jgi:hypothetical protein
VIKTKRRRAIHHHRPVHHSKRKQGEHMSRHAHETNDESAAVATIESPVEQPDDLEKIDPHYAKNVNDPHRRKTLRQVQAYDPLKHFDESKYDMSKGEIANPSVPFPHEPAVAPLPSNQSTGLCVECGAPVAPGQNYVCRDHVRTA